MSDINGAVEAAAEPIPAPEVSTPEPAQVEATPRGAIDRAFDALDAQETSDKVEAKAPVAEEPVEDTEPKGDRERNPDGTFKAKAADVPAEAQTPVTDVPKPEDKPVSTVEPPSRLSPDAKAAWKDAPPSVQADVQRAFRELEQGIEKYRSDAQAFNDIREFDSLAKQSGTTVKAALSAYVNMEQMLRTDPGRGFIELCKNMGVNPKAVGEYLSGQNVEGGADLQTAAQRGSAQALQQEIAALKAEINDIKSMPVQQQVQDFAAKNPLFNLLANDIAGELQAMDERGEAKDLQRAYDAAKSKYPELGAVTPAPVTPVASSAPAPAAAAAPVPDHAAQTRKGQLSLSGAPSSGSNPANRKPPSSARDALDRAFAALNVG